MRAITAKSDILAGRRIATGRELRRGKIKLPIVWLAFAAAAGLSAPAAEAATAQATTAMRNWKTMDTCARQAQAAFPDFSPGANAKRDAALQNCLNANRLPPRTPASTPGR